MDLIAENDDVSYGLLLQPPPGDLTGPYPALPYLKAYAEQRGHKVRVRDLGIESLYFLVGNEQLARLLDRAEFLRVELSSRRALDIDGQRHYALIASVLCLAARPALLSNAFSVFKDSKRFYNYGLYRIASKSLNAFFGLLSAVHFPTVVTPSDYPAAQALNSMEKVMEHRDPAINPFMEYYERELFPDIECRVPRVIGISMEFATQSVQALVLGRILKERFPGVHITMGGAYLSQWTQLMGEAQFEWLFSCTDSVVCGEGEQAFASLMDNVSTGRTPEKVPNLLYRDQATGEIHRPGRLTYPDLSELPPPDYSDLDLAAYLSPKPVIPYCISRGCHWGKCVFCQNRYGENRQRRYQAVPVDKAIAEMSELSDRYGARQFNFSNDVLDPHYVRRFSDAVIASKRKFLWNTDLRAEGAFTRDLCALAARAGLNSVAIGFESGCQKTLEAMDKGKQIETVRRVMKDLYDHGVATQAMGFFGFPGETEREAAETVEFLEQNVDRISYYVIGLLMVVPGSLMYERPEKYGISSITYDNNALMAPQPVWRCSDRISPAAVNRLYQRLSALEQVFTIDDYPYVGALSTNHGFLYFEKGPGVLKQLRHEADRGSIKLGRAISIEDPRTLHKKMKSLVPRLAHPYVTFRSPFPLERIHGERASSPETSFIRSERDRDYAIFLFEAPVPIGPLERRFLESMDGKRNLKDILDEFDRAQRERIVLLLASLVNQGLVLL